MKTCAVDIGVDVSWVGRGEAQLPRASSSLFTGQTRCSRGELAVLVEIEALVLLRMHQKPLVEDPLQLGRTRSKAAPVMGAQAVHHRIHGIGIEQR